MKKSRILYIDDELDLLDLAVCFFEDEGMEIVTCSDFHEAIRLVRESAFDVVISDAKMPSGSGTDLLLMIKNELRFPGKIMLVTGNLQDPPVGKDVGYDMIVYKPIQFQDLVATVKKILS